ncbi:MAG TPA: N-acetyltransferase [Phycisphaerales bacterium]|nr:N-acetyltransferase [Phycisphaerales bacterium]
MDKGIKPITLRGRYVRLEPANSDHAEAMCKAACDRPFKLFSRHIDSDTVEGCRDQLRFLINHPTIVPFSLFHTETNTLIGGTTYCDIRPPHRGVEIGWTWITPELRGTVVNPEMKLLMLQHAFETDLFETGAAIRVVLKTHHKNKRSQAAIAKLGAKLEGTMRNHVIMPDGSYRHTVLYSITDGEWDAVKLGLLQRLADH